ncbi:MAG: response regulator [Bacteroidetes bacterium]|nr:MAG: response regulator [Bacteroidota bacterium]
MFRVLAVVGIWLVQLGIIYAQPDLYGRIVYLSHTSMYPGEVVVARSLVSNRGNAPITSPAHIYAHYYLSADSLPDSSDVYVGDNQIQSELKAGAAFEEIIRIFNIPDSIPPADYYLLYVLDPDNLYAEANEQNNTDYFYPLHIRPLPAQGPELVGLISNIAHRRIHPGDQVTARSYVRNIGIESTPADSVFLTMYALSREQLWSWEHFVKVGGEFFGDPIPPGREILLDEDLRFPDTLSPGTWYLWYITDTGGSIAEVDETNNFRLWGSLEVRIPWWQQWWAIAAYIVVGGGLLLAVLYGLRRWYLLRRALRAARQLRELEQFKSRFYTNITHEFRTPLTVILGMCEQLESLAESGDKQAFRKAVEMIGRNGGQLLHLINQLLDLARLENDHLTLRPVQADMVSFVRYLVNIYESYAAGKGLAYELTTDCAELWMDFDPSLVQKVLSNLISNAIKFTPQGGKVRIHLSVEHAAEGEATENTEQTHCLIRVSDTGIGIQARHLPHIFDRYYQVEQTDQQGTQGTGVGLALTRELMKYAGGRVSVQSEWGKGSQFSLYFPISQQAPLSQSPLNELDQPLKAEGAQALTEEVVHPAEHTDSRPLVLLVEDNADVIAYLRSCLADKYRIQIARNGREGLEKALETVPDLVVSDVMMPEMDGFALCERLKTDMRSSHIPLILLTAKAATEDKLQGLQHGADAYLVKPFQREELLIRIQQLLLLRKRLQQHYRQAAPARPQDGQPASLEDTFLLKIRDIVLQHLQKAGFDVPFLCQEMGMSHTQVHRKLKVLTGLSISRYIRHLRLEEGYKLLQSTSFTVAEIAYDVGFQDANYFSRTFREQYGLSPTQLRAKQAGFAT